MTATQLKATLTPDLARRWDEFVGRHPRASLYQHTRWVKFASEVFAFEAAWITAESAGGNLTGVLPLIRQQSRLFGDRWVSLPFFNYGGPLAADEETGLALISRAAELARATGVEELEIRDVVPRPGLASRLDKATLRLELPETTEALAAQLGAKLRSQVRRADREQPQVLHGGSEHLAEFFGVFAQTMRDLGTPVLPRRFFSALLERLGSDCHVVILRLGGRTAAAALLTSHGGTMEIPWAGSLRRFRSAAANMRLYWECLAHAIATGHRRFDFGRSTIDSGTYRFKQQWGAQPVQLHWYYPLETEMPSTQGRDGMLMRAAGSVWRRLPVAVANRLGAAFSSGLPW
jgi:FemAB-related protein (PEP-CTERM system-associated)